MFTNSAFVVFFCLILCFVSFCNVFVFLKTQHMFVCFNKLVNFFIFGLRWVNVVQECFLVSFFHLKTDGFVLYLLV